MHTPHDHSLRGYQCQQSRAGGRAVVLGAGERRVQDTLRLLGSLLRSSPQRHASTRQALRPRHASHLVHKDIIGTSEEQPRYRSDPDVRS